MGLCQQLQFVEKAKRYRNITELTPELLHLFIEKIVVGEKSKKYSRTAEQEICIYYRDNGSMDESGEHSETQGDEPEESDFDLENRTDDRMSPSAATDTDPRGMTWKRGGQPKLSAPSQGLPHGSYFVPMIPR